MHYNCLIVDDETDLARMTCEYFELFDVSCAWVSDAAECERFLGEHEVDLLLLDINLGKESGFWFCKKLRESSDIPILFISARQSDEDILVALNIGGDDYIKKPYSLGILLAKVRVFLKRLPRSGDAQPPQEESADSGMADVGSGGCGERISLDEGTFSACVDGKRVKLKSREFYLLKCLYENRNTIVTKEQLFTQVWGDSFFSDGTLNVHIRRLREKLEDNPGEPKWIKTVWGTGYLLETEECAE